MDMLTTLTWYLLNGRVRAIKRYESEADAIQSRVLEKQVCQARDTQWGKEHGYAGIRSYEDFASRVPIGAASKPESFRNRSSGLRGKPECFECFFVALDHIQRSPSPVLGL